MAGDVEHVVDAADDPEISLLIAPRAVAREIISRILAPVLFFVALLVAVNRAQHRRPRFSNDYLPADIRADFFSAKIDNRRMDTEKWKCRAAGFGRNGARQRR